MPDSEPKSRIITTSVLAITCSVVASLLYDKAIPALLWVSAKISEVLNIFYAGYIDRQYKHAVTDPYYILFGIAVIGIANFSLALIAQTLSQKFTRSFNNVFYRYYKAFFDFTMIFCLMLSVIASVLALSATRISFEARRDFNYELALVSPALSIGEIANFNRQWSLMRSKHDYDKLMKGLAEYEPAVKSDNSDVR